MTPNQLAVTSCDKIRADSELVKRHLNVLEEMVRIDSRSFNVNEFEGDRTTPSDMREILACARTYLQSIGFPYIKINDPLPGPDRATPILMAEITADRKKPTLLFYAHLDKQPYMDDQRFEKWGGVPPTQLHWNADRSRAYGRGAADDLSGVIAIGMAVDALLKSLGVNPQNPTHENRAALPCNIKVIFETEEESGSHSLIDQIQQNRDFFSSADGVVITDVVNPAHGIPGLTTSLRGIVQLEATIHSRNPHSPVDPQTALYKVLATLIHEDHSLAVTEIYSADQPVTEEEMNGYAQVPTSVKELRATAGVLSETRLTVPPKKEAVIVAQLRRSFANVRPGHRVSGSIIFGQAGARLDFPTQDPDGLKSALENACRQWNAFNLKLELIERERTTGRATCDLILQSAAKDPHSGINGGPFPVAELQLARMIDRLIGDDGAVAPEVAPFIHKEEAPPRIKIQSLWVETDGTTRLFDDPGAKAVVEIRLAPGNDEEKAAAHLKSHLKRNLLPGFELEFRMDKGASPWMSRVPDPVYSIIMDALENGFGQRACLYGCGGSIPFVQKLMDALGNIPPLCLGAYDPDCRMHEPGESLSMADLLGCARSMVHFMTQAGKAFPNPRGNTPR